MIVADGSDYIMYDGLREPFLKRVALKNFIAGKDGWKPKMAYYLKI